MTTTKPKRVSGAPACTRGYCVRCCAYGRAFYGIERTSIDTERPCPCACHGRETPALERVTADLAQFRYQLAHEADRETETLDALRLCRSQINPLHCPECWAAASVADLVLWQRDAERGPGCTGAGN